jgi:hypothetical protein
MEKGGGERKKNGKRNKRTTEKKRKSVSDVGGGEMDESKNENGLFARGSVSALSPSSLGVISSIPPPISGLKGLTSGAAGAYVAGGGEIDGAGLRDGGPVAAFAPFAPAPPSPSSSSAAASRATTTPTPPSANLNSKYGPFPPQSSLLAYITPSDESVDIARDIASGDDPRLPAAISTIPSPSASSFASAMTFATAPVTSARTHELAAAGPNLASSGLRGARVHSPVASSRAHAPESSSGRNLDAPPSPRPPSRPSA